MAYPAEFNITYYKGDTYEFRIYPKNADNTDFNLTEYSFGSGYDTAVFMIADARGSAATMSRRCFAKISTDGDYVLCSIRPSDSEFLNAGASYVYDVSIRKASGDNGYPIVQTLLTGTIAVTDEIYAGTGNIHEEFDTNKYLVTYHSTGNTSGFAPVDSNQYLKNQTVNILNAGTLEKVGYTFAGWTTSSNGTGNVYNAGDQIAIGTSDINFYSKWVADEHIVTFESNGGSAVSSGTFVTDGSILIPTPEPTKSGYTFAGWYDNEDLTTQVSFPYTPKGALDITLYAKWVEE
jgi:uncharacterized repeat protein (TIGR02543 family)